MLWTVTGGQLAAQTEYVIDGVEEAVGELICGIKQTKVFQEAIGKYDSSRHEKPDIKIEEVIDEEEDLQNLSNRNETVVDLVNGQPRPPLKSRWAKNPKREFFTSLARVIERLMKSKD